ncbi:transcription factor A, mitochondrial isoform X3 [Accipiter gentilis]|uniref:transcription factor A, mitochondrial isoform X3 n=1 Tax=Astur gentilis TaxID=8957 RepID=UPI002110E430|nr:transcription factor A, mitochondrial isoform X3 [Accipiter gentilis]
MAAALALLGRAAALLSGAQRFLRVGGSAEKGLSRGISSDRPPKRPLTAYFRFMKENHNAFRQKNPEATNTELIKKIADAWKELPASQKQVYEESRKTDWQRYKEQLAAYKAQLTPAQAAALREERRKRLAKRRSFRAKRAKHSDSRNLVLFPWKSAGSVPPSHLPQSWVSALLSASVQYFIPETEVL